MADVVLDASVILALLKNEKISISLPDLSRARMSTVNLAEVWTKLAQGNRSSLVAGEYMLNTLHAIVAFSEEHARLSAQLSLQPGGRSLSLGDRACLALAITTNAEIYTADRAWADLTLPCRVHLIR